MQVSKFFIGKFNIKQFDVGCLRERPDGGPQATSSLRRKSKIDMITANPDDLLDIGILPAGSERQGHICATCSHKQRVLVSTPDGKKFAAVWRCWELTQRFHKEILVEPTGSCFDSNSMTDFWSLTDQTGLVW
jgi:hypothetical protein